MASKAVPIAKALLLIAVGCILNNLALEFVVSDKRNKYADKNAGGLLTFLQFVLLSLASFPHVLRVSGSGVSIKPPKVPLRHYLAMTAIFFVMSNLNNLAFAFNISQPLHMVFRSANLVTTFAFGKLFLGERYSFSQLLSVILITAGAAVATLAEAHVGDTATAARKAAAACASCGDASPSPAAAAVAAALDGAASAADAARDSAYMFTWMIGVAILTACLVLQTLLGSYQNWAAKAFGKDSNEFMFYSHAFSLPMFLLQTADFQRAAERWSSSPPTTIVLAEEIAAPGAAPWLVAAAPVLQWVFSLLRDPPIMWTWILLNVGTQWICLQGVYRLIALADPLTVNVALAVRKFLSLLVSIVVFNNTWTSYHWVGAVAVFGGAALFSSAGAKKASPAPAVASSPAAGAISPAASVASDVSSSGSAASSASAGASSTDAGAASRPAAKAKGKAAAVEGDADSDPVLGTPAEEEKDGKTPLQARGRRRTKVQ